MLRLTQRLIITDTKKYILSEFNFDLRLPSFMCYQN